MTKERELKGKTKHLTDILACVLTLFVLQVIIFGPIFGVLRVSATFMLLSLVLTFIIYEGKSGWERIHIVDILLVVLAAFSMGYVIFNYDYLISRMEGVTPVTTPEIVLGIICILVTLEATRRVVGLPMVLISIFLIFYAMYGQFFPHPFKHPGFSFDWIIEVMYLTSRGVFGLPVYVVVNLAYTFVLYGVVLSEMGVIKTFLDFAYKLFGKSRGAPAKACITAGTFVGMASGLPMSTTYIIGIPTIPEMKKVGYKPHVAGAIAAVSGTAAQLMPPVLGVAAFVVAQLLNVPYIEVAKMALLPALLFYFSFFIITHFEALKHKIGRIEHSIPSMVEIFKNGFYIFVVSISILIYLLVQFYPAGLAALYASVAAILLAFLRKDLRKPEIVYRIFVKTGILSVYIAVACAAAGIIIGALVETGLNIKFASLVMSVGQSNLSLALILSAAATIVMGMGMPSIPAYITAASIFAPALTKLGIVAKAAHMFCFYYAVLYSITPPVAFATYAAAQIARADMLKTGFAGVRLGFVTYVIPFFFVLRPEILLIQTASNGISLFTTLGISVISILLVSIGLAGYALKPLNIIERALFLLAGLILIYPSSLALLAGSLLGIAVLTEAGVVKLVVDRMQNK